MRKMKKISRLTAGILSFALALGAVGNTANSYLLRPSTANASQRYYGDEEFEVEIKDAYILRAENDYKHPSLTIIPPKKGYYNDEPYYDYYNHIDIGFYSPEFMGVNPDDDYEELNDAYKELYKKWDKSCELFDMLEEEDRVTLKLVAFEKEEADGLKANLESEGYYNSSYDIEDSFTFGYIKDIKSISIHYYGDINDDGVVDSFDAVTYRKQLAGNLTSKLTEAQFLNGDINLNKEIDEEDLRMVQDYLLGNIREFNGISDIGSVRLDNTIDAEASEGKATDAEFASAEMKFGVDLLKNCFDPSDPDGKNLLLSPLSISTALSMTANGADGQTREQMEKVLGSGLTLDQLNEYMAYYISKLPDEKKTKVYLADSIWFKDKPSFQVYDDFLEANKKYYGSEIYKTAFDNSTINDINSWVNKNTHGMIPTLLKNGDLDPTAEKEILMMLINTLYFEAEWYSPYTSSYDGKFTDLDGNEHPIKKMFSQERQYFDLGDADAFKKQYANGEYSFVGIMPKEKNVVDYIKDLDAEKLFEGLKQCEDPETVELNVMIPKFKYNYSKSLCDVLAKMGMPSAFSLENADFSKINDLSVSGAPSLYIDDVIHKTKIEVTEKGTKAAAVTAVMMGAGSAMPKEKKKVNIYLDKPFVYMIVDKNNVPLFIGAATQIEEN